MKKAIILFLLIPCIAIAQQPKTGNDVTTPLHALQPDYPVPYGAMSEQDIKKVIDRIYAYLDAVTIPQMVHKQNGGTITETNKLTQILLYAVKGTRRRDLFFCHSEVKVPCPPFVRL